MTRCRAPTAQASTPMAPLIRDKVHFDRPSQDLKILLSILISMTTLSNSFASSSSSTAIIIPGSPALEISYAQLGADVTKFQQKLAKLGIAPQSAVSIALPNSYPFIVAFLAASWQRAIAAPLNPAYKQSEHEFYIDDLSSALVLVPQGQADGPASKAARKYEAAVAECYLDPRTHEVVLD
ncbi:hypothetical protein LTR95_003184, partial [Oleoguttula sp. CCFEE 5521]